MNKKAVSLFLSLVLLLSPPVLAAEPLRQTAPVFPEKSLYQNLSPEKKTAALRRIDITFFVSLPFTILYGTLLSLILDQAVGLKALVESGKSYFGKVTGPAFISSVLDTNVLFIAANAILWSSTIAYNSFYENLAERNRELLTESIDRVRVHLNFFHTYF